MGAGDRAHKLSYDFSSPIPNERADEDGLTERNRLDRGHELAERDRSY